MNPPSLAAWVLSASVLGGLAPGVTRMVDPSPFGVFPGVVEASALLSFDAVVAPPVLPLTASLSGVGVGVVGTMALVCFFFYFGRGSGRWSMSMSMLTSMRCRCRSVSSSFLFFCSSA